MAFTNYQKDIQDEKFLLTKPQISHYGDFIHIVPLFKKTKCVYEMKNKLNITFKDGCDNLLEALGIDKKRGEELQYRLAVIVHEITKPLRQNEKSPESDQLVKLCIALAENEQELVFCAYIAGMKVNDLFDIDEEEYEEDDDWLE